MSTDLCLTNEKNKNYINKEFTKSDIDYLNTRLSYLEKIIESKYSDILNLAAEISGLNNLNLKYDLVDILVKHGSNLTKYKAELIDVKDMISYYKRISNNEENKEINSQSVTNDIENAEPHNSHQEAHIDVNSDDKVVTVIDSNVSEAEENQKQEESVSNESNDSVVKEIEQEEEKKNSKIFPIKSLKLKSISKNNEEEKVSDDDKREAIRQKILNNLNKLISYKENTFNDLIEMVGFNIDSNGEKVDLSKFIEALESQIVELNQYKSNILDGYSLSKSIELGSSGQVTFSRIFIEKERLLAKNKEDYIKVLTNMYNLYSEFVDNYLKNINFMKPHLSEEKIKSMQTNCGKVIYDFKLIRALYSSLKNQKGV